MPYKTGKNKIINIWLWTLQSLEEKVTHTENKIDYQYEIIRNNGSIKNELQYKWNKIIEKTLYFVYININKQNSVSLSYPKAYVN